MSVKSYPTNSPDLVGTLAAIRGQSVGWQPPSEHATVNPMAADDPEVGKRVEALRTERGWSRETLAYHAQLSSKTVERIEKGQVEARGGTLRAIADALEVDKYAILGEPATPAGVPLSDQLAGVVTMFAGRVDAIEKRQKEIVKALAVRAKHDKRVEDLLDTQTDLLDMIRSLLTEDPEPVSEQDRLAQHARDTRVRAFLQRRQQAQSENPSGK